MRSLTVIFAALLGVLAGAEHADAQGRRGHRAARQNVAVTEALGGLQWGMSTEDVFNYFRAQIDARYLEDVRGAHDAIEEDDLRARRDRAVQRLRAGYVRFDGEPSGWENSFLRNEFFHEGGLSMLTRRDGNSQNFYFFADGKLWKWYKAFNPEVFSGREQDEVARALQGRFGNARSPRDGWLEWRSADTRVRAIDERQFYGIYSIVFENREVAGHVASARPEGTGNAAAGHPLVEAVTGQAGAPSFANADVVDQITGRTRRAQDISRLRRQLNGTQTGMGSDPAALPGRSGAVPTIRDRDDDDGAK